MSPKSSLLSSRLAEPETADYWVTKLVEFSNNSKDLVHMAIEKTDLVKKMAKAVPS